MIRFATKDDTQLIIQMWYQSFKDEKIFTDYFFENLYNYKTSIVFEVDGKIVSTLQRIPFYIENVGKATYIYGACTIPSHRGKGYMKELLNVCENLDRKEKIKASILIPQSESLFEFYNKFGYEPYFYLRKENYKFSKTDSNLEFFIAEKSDAEKIKKLYMSALIEHNFLYRKEKYIQDQIEMFKSLGGEVFLLQEKNSLKGYAFVWNDDKPFIQEIICKDKFCENILANEIMHYYNTESIEIFSPYGENNTALGSAKFYYIQPCEIKANLLFN